MTSVSSTRQPQSPRPATRESHGAPVRPLAAPDDLRAIGDAFAKARQKLDRFTAGKEQAGERGAAAMPKPRTSERDTDRRPVAADRSPEAPTAGAAPLAAAPAPLPLPAMPAAHVDPSGFAQMLADLWTRENGKGAKEIRVRFGEDAWPATGARLVRNAAGALDIALHVAPAGAGYGQRLGNLGDHLRAAGLPLGALAIDPDESA